MVALHLSFTFLSQDQFCLQRYHNFSAILGGLYRHMNASFCLLKYTHMVNKEEK